MLRLMARKLLLALLILPFLNFLGFMYAQSYPGLNPFVRGARREERLEQQSYVEYVRGLLAGDWGQVELVPVSELMVEALGNSLILLAAALLIIIVLGPLLGYLSISSRTYRITPLALLLTVGGASMPGFFFGVAIISLMLYLVLYSSAISTTPLPISGFGLDKHLLLPILVLASRPMLQVARISAGLIEHELQQDYVRVARSKGLSWRGISWQHVWPNIISPVVVTIGQSMRLLISGLIIVEALFQWPGIGSLFMLCIGIRTDGRAPSAYFANPELLAAIAVIFGIMLLLTDLIISILSTTLDPRLQENTTALTP